MEAEVLTPLNALENSLNVLVTSITTTHTFTNAPTASKDLLSADDSLASALNTLKQHQNNYARILDLRAEAARLHEQIKSIIRTCVDLRSEVGNINPSILVDSDEEEEDEKAQEVDYKMLLSLAARIGKHNAVAAKEAEEESNRRTIEARAQAERSKAVVNGDTSMADGEASNGQNATEESSVEMGRINDAVASQRAASGVAFPPAESLRRGALGRLQKLREEKGEQAVEAEIERMMTDSENVRLSSTSQQVLSPQTRSTPMKEHSSPVTASVVDALKPKLQNTQAQQPRQSHGQAQAKRKLDLDFPGSDDDDED